ncbi:MAG: hypothetical protein ACIAXF_16420, partial [Phycisphaerales bacterium JB063]
MTALNFRRFGSLAILLLVTGLMSMPAYAQGGRGGRGGGGEGGRDGGRQRFEDMSEEEREAMMEQFRQRMAERQAEMDEQLRVDIDASEEEFEVLLPKIERVRQLTRERQMASAGAAFGGQGRGGRGGGEAGGRGGRGGEAGGRGDRFFFEHFAKLGLRLDQRFTFFARLEQLRHRVAPAADVKDALEAYRE